MKDNDNTITKTVKTQKELLTITYKKTYDKAPNIVILHKESSLKDVWIQSVTKEKTIVALVVAPHYTKNIKIVFTINGDKEVLSVPTQFCPSCCSLLGNWPTLHLVAGPKKRIPISICPFCGNLFYAAQQLEELMNQITGESRIIVPS